MSPATSVLLDLLRIGAALVVFLAHSTNYWDPSLTGPMQGAGHAAVIVFFVLSGYVIAHTAREGPRDGRAFVAARLARLYSVVVPALVLTVLLWPLGRDLDPGFYDHYSRHGAGWRHLLSLFFLNEVWFWDACPPGNEVFWSLGYEALYYLLFGLFWYVRPTRRRVLLLLCGGLVAGPKVLLLLPVWLAGASSRLWRCEVVMDRRLAAAGAGLSLAGAVAVSAWLPSWPGAVGAVPWGYSAAAASDLAAGLCWAAGLWFFEGWARTGGRGNGSGRLGRLLRWGGNLTFPLYLYHVPLVLFITALMPPLGMDRLHGWGMVAGILLAAIVLGVITERVRPWWRRGFDRLLGVSLLRGEAGVAKPEN